MDKMCVVCLEDESHDILMGLIDNPKTTLESFAKVYLCISTYNTNADYSMINEAIENRWPSGLRVIGAIGRKCMAGVK